LEEGKTISIRFAKSNTFISKNSKEQIVKGVVYAPDEVDLQGDKASKQEIWKGLVSYMLKSRLFKFEHSEELTNEDVALIEIFQAPVSYWEGEQRIKEGSLVMSTKIFNKSIWEAIEKGEITGYSMGGTADRAPIGKSEVVITKSMLKRKISDNEGSQISELINIEIEEISFVKLGANNKKFALIKSAEATQEFITKNNLDWALTDLIGMYDMMEQCMPLYEKLSKVMPNLKKLVAEQQAKLHEQMAQQALASEGEYKDHPVVPSTDKTETQKTEDINIEIVSGGVKTLASKADKLLESLNKI